MKPRFDWNDRGVILPLIALCMVALCGFMALAIDLGTLSVAKTQAQNAADAAALAAVRSLDGNTTPNLTLATANALKSAAANTILGAPVAPSCLQVQHGTFHYDPVSQTFVPRYNVVAPDNYNLSKVTVTRPVWLTFARLLGIPSATVSASAVATHRPRDVTIILDFSGSMNNESDLWNCESYLGSANNTPNSTDAIVPKFGPYPPTSSATLCYPGSDSRVGKCNVTQPVLGMPALVDDFYQHARGTSPVAAFTAASNSLTTTPGGDDFLRISNNPASNYAYTLLDVNGKATSDKTLDGSLVGTKNVGFEGSDSKYGYDWYIVRRAVKAQYPSWTNTQLDTETVTRLTNPNPTTKASLFQGYTQGPKYWGKTFFIWPPNPEDATYRNFNFQTGGASPSPASPDWRKRFFLKPGGSYPSFGGPVDDNTILWNSSGVWRDPGTASYVINYKAILAWIKNCGPNAFPSRLRAGRILYYDQIPDDVPSSAYTHTNANSQITDQNQRFWKEYIDYTLGVWRDPFGTIQHVGNPACSLGPDWSWTTTNRGMLISAKPTGGDTRYMVYNDNPQRPRHHFWFGPMTMVQFISDTGLNPGTAHDISMYSAKLGIAGALQDIMENHPNDLVSLILFNRPQYANDPANMGSYNQALFNLSRNYSGMIDALWYPLNSDVVDVRTYDLAARQVPRAFGDFTSNTATHHGFMLAYNQLSGSAALRSQTVGGTGRKGAQRMIILETDGMANVDTTASLGFYNGGSGASYYHILPGETITSAGYSEAQLLGVVNRICASETDLVNGPGFTEPRKPVAIHTIAFGAIFESTAAGTTDQTNSVAILQKISTIGQTVFPSSAADPANGYKWCIGTIDDRKNKLRQAFGKVMDDGACLSLIRDSG